MKTFWLTFTDGTRACCQGTTEFDAKQIAEKFTGKTVSGGTYRDLAAEPLPHPAHPAIWLFDHPLRGKSPLFCYRPDKCAGRTSCPQRPACTE